MIRMAALHRVYLIGLLVLLQAGLANSVLAGTDVWTGNESGGGYIPDLAIDPGTLPARRPAAVIPTRTTTYYLADRVINNADFAKLANWGVNTAIVDFDVNGPASAWRAVFTSAGTSKIDIVIWPSDWDNPRPSCGWEAPYPVSTNGNIEKVKPLLDVASQYTNFIGIVNAHESFWSCDMSFDEMAGLKDKLKAYALSKGREIKVWNYIDNLYDKSMLPDNQIGRIMDVAVTWQHCAGNAEGTCNTSSSTSALNMILNDRGRIAASGAQVELVFLMQTFTTNGYNTKFTLTQLQDYSCQFLNTSSLDGFGFYTWQAGWWPDLHNWPELQPAVQYIYGNCTNNKTPTFSDVPASHQYFSDIEILYANGLTGGCQISPLKFCPDQTMDRGQSAVFMLRGKFGSSFVPGPAANFFKDDWTKGAWAEPWAEAMWTNGLSAGCLASPRKYCPWDQMPREQAVIFALRMKYGTDYKPPAATGAVFADMTVVNYYATSWAEQAYKDGLIPNCGTSGGKPKICPKVLVSRGLGAYMIVRAKNLSMP
jgi:hypothetical protein